MNEDGYAQIWGSRGEDFEEKFDSIDNQAYIFDAPGYEEGMLFETDAGPAFVGRKDGNVVFAGSRAAANRAYDEFAQDLGAYQEGFNGVEETQQYKLEPEIQEMLSIAEEATRGEDMMEQILGGEWIQEGSSTSQGVAEPEEAYSAMD